MENTIKSCATGQLQKQIEKLLSDLVELNLAETKDANKIKSTSNMLDLFNKELATRQEPEATNVQIKSENTAVGTRNADYRTMENYFKESVQKFIPGVDVTTFIFVV